MKFIYKGAEYDLNTLLSKDDIYTDKNIAGGKPIVAKSGIIKLREALSIREGKPEFTINTVKWNGEPIDMITCLLPLYYNGDEPYYGDGEASSNNTTKVSEKYPFAMAKKRARSRGILELLGIDAYGEDEADEFSQRNWNRNKRRENNDTESDRPTEQDKTTTTADTSRREGVSVRRRRSRDSRPIPEGDGSTHGKLPGQGLDDGGASPELISEPQRKMMKAMEREIAWKEAFPYQDYYTFLKEEFSVESSRDLTKDQAKKAIDLMETWATSFPVGGDNDNVA